MKLSVRYYNESIDSDDLKKICQDPNGMIDHSDRIIKHDRTTTLCIMDTDIGPLVIKRYNAKNLWCFFKRNFRKSRAVNVFNMSKKFRTVGVKVPTPLAAIESVYWWWCKGPSWYISQYIHSDLLIDFIHAHNDTGICIDLTATIIDFFKIMKSHQLSHGDLKATNLLLKKNTLYVIDLDAAKEHSKRWTHRRALRKDKTRFLKNWNHFPSIKLHFDTHFTGLNL